ncbi:MAG: DNA gyrase subunit A [Firmicutes bacterium]|jgi:DNA gyrase subunit A|nr:DNA gyrase subunit A [Bacillota bacterium]NLL87383.1 DNA gyrase subunit A [Bacillota bacterium]HKM17652.1 DNA gyrase subunit A [Limnochordia bacterium]
MSLDFRDGKIVPIKLVDEMKTSYINYAMSVIVERALPDVRDGLKPVQRRIIYTMGEMGLRHDRPHRKSAGIVGEVMGKFHPHGDSAIYDAMVRMAQDFSYRYPLVDGHGNFGSVDGDPPAAMRYTEARLSRLATEMLRDIDKNTVNFIPNYDETVDQPAVLPSRIPNLIVNGASGIAVGMATNIPPHNLGEVIDGIIMLIDNPDVTIKDLARVIKGPDFPTGGLILGRDGIKDAYETGRGRIIVRGKSQIEQLNSGKQQIIITELPYNVNKAKLIEKIADLVRDKKIDGITDLRDESDRSGMRIVIELRRDANARVILNQLYKHTQLQDTFGVIMLALVDDEPKVLNLKEVLHYYLEHQKEVIIRRCKFELKKAENDAHIREGLLTALDHIDEIISIIRKSANDQAAKETLMSKFELTERQAVAILDMQLRRLTGLEREKIETEYAQLIQTIQRLRTILGDINLIYNIIKEELLELKERFSDPRRTKIVRDDSNLDIEDLIAEEDLIVTLTHQGYIKRLPVDTYRSQRRGGKGITAVSSRSEDFVEQLFVTSTHNYVLFFTNKGRVHRLKGHEIPEAGRNARGVAVVNLIHLEPGERIEATIPISEYSSDQYLIMATKKGIVKKTPLIEYDSPRAGLIGIILADDDEVVSVRLTDGNQEIVLVTSEGQAIRFSEKQVRPMGRNARGVKGVTLGKNDFVVSMDVVANGDDLLVVTENGFGKRTRIEDYRVTNRGGKGIKTLNKTAKTGCIIGAKMVHENNEIMLISHEGIMIRMSVADISRVGRSTQGVILMKLGENDKVVAAAHLAAKDDE